MARQVRELMGDTGGIIPTPAAISLVVGCVAALWTYADTHIREDDTLRIGPDDVDEIVGVHGFVSILPSEWLEVLDRETVKLPGFHGHNGTSAKSRALTAKRVAKHRERVTLESFKVERECNGEALQKALPEKIREEQKRKEPEPEASADAATSEPQGDGDSGKKAKRATRRAPPTWEPSADLLAWCASDHPDVNAQAEAAKFRDYTFGTSRSDWDATFRNWIRKAAEHLASQRQRLPPGLQPPKPKREPTPEEIAAARAAAAEQNRLALERLNKRVEQIRAPIPMPNLRMSR
jgi:hypothetical protein